MDEPYLSQINIFAFNFAPRSWAQCNGQILSIAQNTALFSLLGTTYGGNGQTTFALPDLRGRLALHAGTLSGVGTFNLGEIGGAVNVTLIANQLPQHNHSAQATSLTASVATPNASVVIASGASEPAFIATAPDGQMAANSIAPAGGNQPHNNLAPYLGLNFCIALEGIFPSRN